MLAAPINARVLQALARERKSLMDLRRETGCPAQTTMRGCLRTLNEIGVVTRRRRDDFPGRLDFELTEPGRDLLVVAEVLRAWLDASPEGAVEPGSTAAKSMVKALVEGWDTNMMRALAARPLSLTELDGLISGLSYPSLERRLTAMRLAGQVEKTAGRGGGTPYAVTDWLRRAVAPLAAGARWEREHLRDLVAPVGPRDVETAFLLTVPMLRLPVHFTGSCRLAMEVGNGEGQGSAGVVARVEEGRIARCVTRLEGDTDAWASGPAHAWMTAVIEGNTRGLEFGGDRHLAAGLTEGLHEELFEPGDRAAVA